MFSKRLLPVVLAGLTLVVIPALFASEQSRAQPLAMVDGECAAPGVGLISWWPGDETYDDVAPPIDGTVDPDPNPIVDPNWPDDSAVPTTTFEDGMVGKAFRFAGVENQPGNFLEVPDAPDLRPASFTVDLWAQRLGAGQRAYDAFGSMLVQKAIDNERVTTGMSYYIGWRGDGRIVADVGFGSQAGTPRLVGEAVPMDTWVHVALTVDENRTATLYLDGVVQAEFTGPAGVLYGDGSIVIGNNWYAARKPPANFNRGFDGRIDQLELFDHALSATEIAQLHTAGTSGECTATKMVELDVWPGRRPNRINMRNWGVVAAAILGSADFDVNDIDRATLGFGPNGAHAAHWRRGHVMDVNRDGFKDLVSHYWIRATGLSAGDTEACVTGALTDGTEIEGCDTVTLSRAGPRVSPRDVWRHVKRNRR